ncbi:MAG: hypothetical protein Q4A52_07965, partial [Bacillota bacterium]|nr:hypothetical protein [Bacillota bacterium]
MTTVNPAVERGGRVVVAIGDLPEVIDPIYPDTEVTRWVLSLTTFSVFDMISEHEVRDGGREHR